MASYLDVKVQAVLKAQKEQGALRNAGQIKYIHACLLGRIRISRPDALTRLSNIARKGGNFEGK